jgi:ELWxxDGT repeat protein
MRRLLVLLSLCAMASPLSAAAPYQVADLRTTPHEVPSSRPVLVATINGAALFTTFDEQLRASTLWRSDGTAAGTQRLVQFSSYTDVAATHVRVGETIYFSGFAQGEYPLWKTDGTVAGTSPVVADGGVPLVAVGVAGDRVLFVKDARELWAVDAQGGQQFLATLRSSFASTRWNSRAQWRDHVYLAYDHGLLKSDGTPGGTTKLIAAQSWALTVAQDRLFFIGRTGETGTQLWTTDGSEGGTHAVSSFSPELTFTVPTTLAPVGNGLLFFGYGGELGFSDGTAAGTRVLRTGVPLFRTARRVAMLNGIAYFGFDDGVHGHEMWRSDGTDAGTYLVGGPSPPFDALTASGSKLYYFTRDVDYAYALIESDGTAAGTNLLHDLSAGSSDLASTLAVVGDKILFPGWDAEHGHEVWVHDATGARMLVNIAAEDPGSSDPAHLLAHGDQLYFIADDDLGSALWRTDGTAAGTKAIVREEWRGDLPRPLVSFGDALYLTNVQELRKIEGDSDTDILVETFPSYPGVEEAGVTNGRLYLLAEDGENGDQLWTTDGTGAGTIPITSLDRFSEKPLLPVSLAGRDYFLTQSGKVYETDGTPGGNRLVAEPANDDYPATNLFSFGPSLYYFTRGALRKLSGSAADVQEFALANQYPDFAVARDAIFFAFTPSSAPAQLWTTDGTWDGTKFVREFAVAADDREVQLVSIGDRVVFGVDDGINGFEPWVSDGTAEGTRLLRDISSGSSDADGFFVVDGVAYFAATDELHGRELWQTDGTPEGTKLVADIHPGTASSSPEHFTRVGNTLYFSARSTSGRELWAYELPGDVTVTIDDARASESAGSIAMTVRLNRPSAQPVEVDYHTADDTAKAGRDYTAAGGRLTFAPGETVKTVTIPIAGDSAPGTVRGFFVRLTNVNVALERAVAGGIIEDDDVSADLVLSLVPYGEGARLRVENSGPSSASNVVLCYARPPSSDSFQCAQPFVLKAGQAHMHDLDASEFGSGAIVARVTQWESDSAPANNASTWSVADRFEHVLYVHPAEPRVGELVTITVTARGVSDQPREIRLISSWYRVITLPQTVTIPANEQSVTITAPALESGVVIIAIDEPTQAHGVTVFVYAPLSPLKATPILRWEDDDGDWGFGPRQLTLQVSGLTVNGERPTGTVEFRDTYSGGTLGTVPVRNGKATILITPDLGWHQFSVRYSGDANFAAHNYLEYLDIDVVRGPSRIRAERIPGTNDLLVTIIGVDGYAPTGLIYVEDADHSADRRAGVLTPVDSARSTFIATGLATANTVYVDYRGDQHYAWETIYLDFGRSTKKRGVRK